MSKVLFLKQKVVKDDSLHVINVSFFKDLLSHLDDLEEFYHVLESETDSDVLIESLANLINGFKTILRKKGIKVMKCQGISYNPEKHHASLQISSNQLPENKIMDIIRKGYYYKGDILRPADVVVSKKA